MNPQCFLFNKIQFQSSVDKAVVEQFYKMITRSRFRFVVFVIIPSRNVGFGWISRSRLTPVAYVCVTYIIKPDLFCRMNVTYFIHLYRSPSCCMSTTCFCFLSTYTYLYSQEIALFYEQHVANVLCGVQYDIDISSDVKVREI